MAAKRVLITGGSGYLGLKVAQKYLESTEDPVVLWLHATGRNQFKARLQRVHQRLADPSSRLTCCGGDITADEPFASVDPREIGAIVHTAAVTRFNVDSRTAQRVNVAGMERLLRFALRCPSLEALGLLSTVYASGLRSGMIEEKPERCPSAFANYYESSKWESESLLLGKFPALPWRIFRLATVIADDDEGRVEQQNAFHNSLKLLYYGLLSLIPGDPRTPLYFVTGNFATEAVFSLMGLASNNSIYHVAHRRDESISLGDLVDLAFHTFEEDENFENRRILKPLYSDLESFELLAQAAGSFSSVVVHQALASVVPFAKQLFVHKEIENRRFVSAVADYHAPEAQRLVQNTCRYLMKTKWGKYAYGQQ